MAETIAQAVEQIKSTVSLISLDESATKQVVVLRLLSLAGWNTYDVSAVSPEYAVGSRRVDFALRPGSANAVFIEVKRARVNLDDHQQQLLEYCFREGVRLAVLTNGRTWWLYLPLQAGNWEQRRFLDIDLESHSPQIIENWFMTYLSQEKVTSGRAVSDAEELFRSRQRAEVTSRAIVEAWKLIVGTPDEMLVDLISKTTEHICGFQPEPESVRQFLSGHVYARGDVTVGSTLPAQSGSAIARSARRPRRQGHGSVLPITLDPEHSADFLTALLHTKEAWLEVSYSDGRKEVRRWYAPRMSPSSNVIGNLRSRSEFRAGTWQQGGIVSLRVSIEPPARRGYASGATNREGRS